MAKESYRLNTFHLVDESMMWYNKEYPPFFTLFQVLFCKLMGGFSEGYCYRAITLFSLCLFLPLFDKFKSIRKDGVKIILLLIMVGLVPMAINFTPGMVYKTLFYNSIYLDIPIGILLAYIFYIIYCFDYKDRFCYLSLSFSLSALVLTKQISIAFYLLCIVTWMLKVVMDKQFGKELLIKILCTSFLPLLFYCSWSFLVNFYGIEAKFSISSYDFMVLPKYFLSPDILTEQNRVIISNFIEAFIDRSLIIQPIKLSYFQAILFSSIGIITFSVISKQKTLIMQGTMYFLGGLGYAYAMLLSYVFSFGYLEGPSLAMYDRYMSTYIIFGIAFIFFIAILNIKKNQPLPYVIVLIIMIPFISFDTVKMSKPVFSYNGLLDFYNKRFVNFVESEIDNERVLVISQNDVTKRNVLRYYVIEKDKQFRYLDISYAGNHEYDIGEAMWEDDYWALLMEYDYIYICDYDESFIHFWEMTTTAELKMDHFYKIECDEMYNAVITEIGF